MPAKEQDTIFEAMLREMETRANGRYPSKPSPDNIAFIEEYTLNASYLPFSARQRFKKAYMPQIKDLRFRFHSIEEYLGFHLPFAKRFPRTPSKLYFEGPEDAPELFGMHEGCNVVDGVLDRKGRGCDICATLALLDSHLPDDCPEKPLASAIETKPFFPVRVSGTNVWIKGTYRDGKVRSLVVDGFLHLLDWDLYQTSTLQREIVDLPKVVDAAKICSDVVDDSRHTTEAGETATCSQAQKEVMDSPKVADSMRLCDLGDKGYTMEPEKSLICFHDLTRPGFQHHEDKLGCWEVLVAA